MTPKPRPQQLRFLLLGVALAAAACRDATAPLPLANATARAKAIWNAAGIQSYSFTASRSCFCTPEAVGPVRVSVVNGAVSSVVLVSTGDAVAPAIWFDIGALFALVETELAARPTLLQATFDSATGYPTHVKYGDIAVDAGAEIVVTDLVVAPN